MLRNAQWMCVGIGVAQLVLLVATYAFEGHGEAAYVSDELDHFAWFRILLTGTVIAQICVGSFYLYEETPTSFGLVTSGTYHTTKAAVLKSTGQDVTSKHVRKASRELPFNP